MPLPARMSDVAKVAGVSTMTVSRVLNDNQSVLEDTRRRVFAAVEQLGYRRNEVARSLRERRSRQIGILIPNLYDHFFAIIAHIINGVAKQHGYSVSIATTDENPETEFSEANRMLLRNIEGLIVIPAESEDGVSRLLSPTLGSWPIVTVDRPLLGNGHRVDSLLVQNRRGAQLGTHHLLSLGRKRVAFVGLNQTLYTMRKRYEGYTDAMREAGLKPQAIFVNGGGLEATRTELSSLLRSRHAPDALFCANNLVTRQVLQCLQEMGMHAPESVGLVGFDDFETADLLRPGVTVVRQPTEPLARGAAMLLFERMQGLDTRKKSRRTVLPVELVIRGSCGAKDTSSAFTSPEPPVVSRKANRALR